MSLASISMLALALATQSPDTTATKRALLDADRALVRSGNVLAQLEPGATVMLPGLSVIRGSEEGGSAYRTRYLAPGVRYTWTPLHAVVSSDGRLGCTTGAGQLTPPGDSGTRHGRYLTCWRRRNDGAWRIVVLARAGESPPDQDANVPVSTWPHSATGPSVGLGGALDADELFARVAVDFGPGPAFGRFAAVDGMLLGARPVPPAGPDSIRSRFDGFPADQRLMWSPSRDLGAASGGLAITIGEATTGAPGSPPASYSKYVTVWRLEPDGAWRFVFDIGSARPAN